MKIVITGATGFIGKNIVRELLRKNIEVISLGRGLDNVSKDFKHVRVDLLKDHEKIRSILQQEKPTHLIHLAWITEHGKFWNAYENLDWVKSSILLLRDFEESGGIRAVLAGSCAEAEDGLEYIPESLNTIASKSLYGRCKSLFRELAFELAATTPLEVVWGRIFYMYGPNEDSRKFLSNIVFSLIKSNQFTLRAPFNFIDYTHVHDVASAFLKLIDGHSTGQFNIASGTGVFVKDIACLVQNSLGRGSVECVQNEFAPSIKKVIGVSHRLKEEYHWNPVYDLSSGISEFVNWYITNNGSTCQIL